MLGTSVAYCFPLIVAVAVAVLVDDTAPIGISFVCLVSLTSSLSRLAQLYLCVVNRLLLNFQDIDVPCFCRAEMV